MNNLATVKRSPLAIALLVAAAVAMVYVSERSNHEAQQKVEQLGSIGSIRVAVQSLAQSVLDAESGQRGYLLTGREEYLAPYNAALPKIDNAFKLLDAYYAKDTKSLALIRKLHALTETKLSELLLSVQLQREGKRQTSMELVLSGIGSEYMDAVRKLSSDLVDIETENLAVSRQEIFDTLLFGRLSVAVLSAISLLAILVNLRQSAALDKQQQVHQQSVQAERERLEQEVVTRTMQLTELNNHLQTAREDERNRLARDLHDELGALLTSAKLDAARIKSRLGASAPESLERLGHLVETLNAGIALKRRIIEDLRPSALSNLGLVATLEILAREFAERSGLAVHCVLEPVELEATADLVIYRLVQEAFTNIAKYAHARNIWLTLASSGDQAEINVRDDGIGFDTGKLNSLGHGLLGMRFRVEAEDGTLELVSTPGEGTLIRARLPQAMAQTQATASAPA